ncbi:hypothetical protein L1887_28638 [Cichorium endivia]|nr:hypothetical protein L1887_28638 [Cichorium endivia]
MASGSSLSSMLLFGKRNEEENVNQAMNIQQDIHLAPPAQPQNVPHLKKRRNPPRVPCKRDSFITHRAFCDALAEGVLNTGNQNNPSQMNINLPQLGSQVPSTQNLTGNSSEITPGVSQMGQKSYNNVMIRTSTELNYHKTPPTMFGPSSVQGNNHKYQENLNTRFFTNLVNSTTTSHNNMQLYNLSFMGNIWNSGSGEGSTLLSGGRLDHSASLYLSSHTSGMLQLSATGLLQKAAILGSTSSTTSVTNFARRYVSSSSVGAVGSTKSERRFLFGSSHFGNSGSNGHHTNMNELLNSFSSSGVGSSIFNQCTGATNEQGDDDEWKTSNSVEQPPPQNPRFNMGFEQFSGVKTTRDFLGVGVEVVDNRSSDGPKSNFAGRSFL